MSRQAACAALRDGLVDLADGELSESEAAAIEAHLRQCADCARLLAALRRSLDLATDVWESALEPAPPPLRTGGRRRWWLTARFVAAAAVVALMVRLWTAPSVSSTAPLSAAELTREIHERGMAARWLAVGDLALADEATRSYATNLYQNVIERYPGTTPASLAAQRLRATKGDGG